MTNSPFKRKFGAGYRLIFGYLSLFVSFAGLMLLLPLIMLIFYPEEYACYKSFLIPGAISIVVGLLLSFVLMKGEEKARLGKHQDSVLLCLIWILTVLLGSLPFYLSQFFYPEIEVIKMSFSESVFESVSGFSAAGLTVFRNLLDAEVAYGLNTFSPHVYLFYRALTQFFGGIGLVLVVASAVSDRYGMKLFYAEGHNDRLLPNLAKTAKITFSIYCLIIALGTLGLWMSGMDGFEALCHSMTGMATGGFSTRSTGFYYFESSAYIGNGIFTYNPIAAEIVTCIIMLLGATSFLLIYNLLRGKVKNFFKDCEIRFACFILIFFILSASIMCMYEFDYVSSSISEPIDYLTSLRYSGFQIISCLTTTGFGNVPNVAYLGPGAIYLSILAMIIGGGVGSTAGAIKQYRVVIILKELKWSIKYKLTPRRQLYPHNVTRAGKTVEVTPEVFRDASLYASLYIVVLFVLSLALVFLPNISITVSIYEVSSALSGTGNTILDFLAYKANNALYCYDILLWLLSLAMLLGRLEIMPFYYFLVRTIKDIAHQETN
ncbi:MAG: hypothetical protein MR659_00335 [Mollicutes bacterium]|nr:hypothetical protein [Mollicutes bacterium]MDY3904139.1 potassium transporter TrkG [Candidatus Enteromonas sp.]